ncbi:putative inositol(myo)-1(or 4)-monophosphatase 2 [Cardiosporidium cionae]|uniref:Inositol-1-monophosphatase n=1 Tax=Cardiosporidium cionae TaxID=476202 RepID=A0ABQ7JC83_9APIC|nr:putative inositol(myo)-1(or 4)-monophosphatase 2 [Cardiosporidium cionae]|eukprot:KAF8821631.1 putative inositol(myo)-1(or 4)-monophosphatase 2 [Cardiosporidium cionae]
MEADFEVTATFVKELAILAGSMILESSKRTKRIEMKKTFADLVTETDVSIERELIGRIRAAFPSHRFLCEESSSDKDKLSDEPTWIIDPIDGTTNYIHGFPFYCVSIAFARNRIVLIGCVNAPSFNELFFASKGGGAYLNGERIFASDRTDIATCLLATDWNSSRLNVGSDALSDSAQQIRSHIKARNMKNLDAIVHRVRNIRCLGASALELCFIAAGRLDLLFQFGPHEWDIAAGMLMVQEAGGVVMDIDGTEPLDIGVGRVLAASTREASISLTKLISS